MTTLLIACFAYIVIGIISGMLAGLLGIGGGVVTVPCLYVVFRVLGYPEEHTMHMAIGTSLAAMVFSTLSSTWEHHKKQSVLWDLIRKMVPGLILGSILGALVVNMLPGVILEIIFGVFLCIMGIFFFRKRLPQVDGHRLPKIFLLSLISMGIGGISNILGIGGGTLSVPTLNAFRISHKKSIGTSSAISCLITFIGAISYLILGLEEPSAPDNIGFINLTAFFIVGTVSFFAALYTARFAHKLSDHVLKQIFGFVLILTGISMIIH